MSIPPHGRRTFRAAVALSATGLFALAATPSALAATGADASATATASASAGAGDDTSPVVMGKIAPIDVAKPGDTFDAPAVVANTGTGAVDKVWLAYTVTSGLDYTAIPSNCQASQGGGEDETAPQSVVLCEFDQVLQPGLSYAPSQPLVVKTLGRALYDDLKVYAWTTEPGTDGGISTPVPGTAPAVSLVEHAPVDLVTTKYPGTSLAEAAVTTVNTADYRVTGDHLKGRVGDTVTMNVTFANVGPAWVLRPNDPPYFRVLVTPPAGTSVVKSSGLCEKAKGGVYACGTYETWINEGENYTYTFKLKIDKRVPGAKGSVAMSGEARPFDHDKADDTAAVTLDVTGGGTAPTPSATPTPGSTATPSAAPTPSSSAAPGAGGGQLAATGSSDATLPLAGAGVAAVALGAGALLAARRRSARARG